MIRVPNIALELDAEAAARGGAWRSGGPLCAAVARALSLPRAQVVRARVLRRSIDARKRSHVHFNVTAAAELSTPAAEAVAVASRKAQAYASPQPLVIPQVAAPADAPRPVVVGTGPAGLFCALYLARAGARPLVVERGAAVDDRARQVAAFDAGGPLSERTNIQFGEGGAGTFSDGKLTTNTKHRMAPYVLRWFVDAGAPEDILWDAKPHIGSDRLPAVVARMRKEIVALGGEVRFGCRLVDARFAHGVLASVVLEDASGARETVPATRMVLAPGHSARDTFEAVRGWGVALEQKPFSMGVRIEHLQAQINRAQWGAFAAHPALAHRAADYKMAVHVSPTRSAYTFCMCPGGTVTCAASEEGGIVTNGMSNYARDGRNANAALLVNVDPADFPGPDPLAGVALQRSVEQAAYRASLEVGGAPYQAPAQTVGDFLAAMGRPVPAARSKRVRPTYARGTVAADLRTCLPGFVCDTIADALPRFDARLRGFSDPAAVLTAPETRSSSPVRICRGKQTLQAWLPGAAPGAEGDPAGCGVYPCGEGAGYAGGIMSAACDGMRVAQRVAQDMSQARNE